MPLSSDGGPGVGDDFSEPAFTADELTPLDPPVEPPEAIISPTPEDDGYEPYDPLLARPSHFDPVGDDGALDLANGKPRLRDNEGKVLPEFDEKYQEDFHGLAFIGALSKRFEWLGHRFLIRTVTVDEALCVSLLTKQYADSLGGGLSYRTAMAAMAVQQIDGKDLPIPVGPDDDPIAYAQQRFDYAKARWFQFTIDRIYNEYLELDTRVRQVVEAMEKASGQTVSTSG